MEIEQLRQELNHLLENVVDHSGRYSEARPIPSLEVSFVLKKINKMQENLTILKYLLKEQEKFSKQMGGSDRKTDIEDPIVESIEREEETIIDKVIQSEPVQENVSEDPPLKKEETEQPSISKLSDGLTLNDRYLFANELFNKDMSAFNDLVKSIDECSSLDEAIALYSKSDWELDNVHVISFTNLVERRFS